jgi:hypothetical protein
VHPLPRSGTLWNEGATFVTPPFDIDGVAGFSAEELEAIVAVWRAVSEDYAAFDVDVTTQDPGVAGLAKAGSSDVSYGIRMCIGGSSSDWWGGWPHAACCAA